LKGRESRFPVVLTALLLLLSLAVLGVGYGMWSKTLFIRGTVNTGTVDAKWVGAICVEFHSWPNFPQSSDDLGEFEGKDVGSTYFQIDQDDDQIVHVTVTNGYPSYAVDCEMHFEYEGTIPVIVRGTNIVPISENLTNCVLSSDQPLTLSCDQLTVIYTDGIGSQLHQGAQEASSLTIHVEQPADQLSTYKFEVWHCMAQWNEDATAEECFVAAP
jgi:hypothetical protein